MYLNAISQKIVRLNYFSSPFIRLKTKRNKRLQQDMHLEEKYDTIIYLNSVQPMEQTFNNFFPCCNDS